MSNVRSRPLHSAGAPLPREWLDNLAPAVRVGAGVLFIAWSWTSTILLIGRILAPVIHDASTTGLIADRYLVGILVAVLVSVVEFVASDRWPGAYWMLLLTADADFTAFQTHEWLYQIASAHTTVTPVGDAAIWLVAVIGGIIAAIFGEVLLFGKRRKEEP